MKIVSLIGSYRQNGNTEKVIKLLEEKLVKLAEKQNISLSIDHILLSKKYIKPCCGCRVCFDKGEEFCPSKDDLLRIREQIAEADALIFASPVYVEDVSGSMKNFIDRLAFYCHRPALFGKCAAVIVTSGSGSSNHSILTITNALNAWGARVVSRNKFKMGARMETQQVHELFDKDIENTAKRLLDSVKKGNANCPAMYSLIAFQIQKKIYQKRIHEDSVDVLYWKSNGWLESSCNYYTKMQPHPIKMICAKVIGGIVIKFLIT